MGTSASSKGPGSGVPLVPAWVDNNPAVAAPARFRSARTNLGSFAKSGADDSLKQGLGHYSRSGLGGSATGTARMGRTTAAAGGFADVLSALRDGSPLPSNISLDPATLTGKSQQEIADAIIDAVTPTDGTQDAESSRDSAARAFAELLEINPSVDLTALPQDMVELFFERFLANDLIARIQLDVGKTVLDRAPDPATAVQRLETMQSFVKQEFNRVVQALKNAGQRLQQGNGKALGDAALKATLDIFEGWLR